MSLRGPSIAFVVAEFAPNLDASAKRVGLQADALARRGWRVRVVTGAAKAADVLAAAEAGIHVRVIESAIEAAHTLTPVPDELAAELAEIDVVCVHLGAPLFSDVVRRMAPSARVWVELDDWNVVCGRGDLMAPAALGSCTARQTRAVAGSAASTDACGSCLGPGGSDDQQRELSELMRLRSQELKAEVAAAGRVIVPSRTHLVRLADSVELLPERVRIVTPNQGLGPAARLGPRAPWRGDSPLRLLYHGPRSTVAGLLELVRGLAILQPDRVQLVMVGEQAERGLDDRLRTLAGEMAIQFFAPGALELRRQAARCHVAVLPSRAAEGYPVAVDEAMALGLPVLASCAEAAAERHGADGLEQLEPRDPDAWTDRIGSFLRRPGELLQLTQSLPAQLPGPAETAERLQSLYVHHASPGQNRAS